MEDIYALLNIDKGVLQNFHVQAERIVDHQTELTINRCIRSLKEIEESVLSDKKAEVSQHSIDEVMLKVIENANSGNQDFSIWSTRELRIVSYYLIKLQGNEDAYIYALTLLDKNWRDLFFNGLSFFCLDNWNYIVPSLRRYTCELLRNKLQVYKDENKKYKTMRNYSDLFDESGPLRLSVLLKSKKQDISFAPSYFCNKPSTLSQSYYSDVIVKFCADNKLMDIDYIDKLFQLHNSDRTKKLVLAELVERMNNSGNEIQRNQLCRYVNRKLGDITLSSTWAPFSGATELDAQKLMRAKKLVNIWFNKKIIETFFEVCVQDGNRKTFWLQYVEYLNGFRIVGSTSTKRMLQADPRVSGIFLPYFIETDSYSSQTSALVLFIKNKMMVEFSDTGSLYVYGQGHGMVNLVTRNRNSISSTSDLKIPSMSLLIVTDNWGYTNYYEEGRMTHQGYWQKRLSGWLNRMVLSNANAGISLNPEISLFDGADNDVFKAQPINTEPFKPASSTKVTQQNPPHNKPENQRTPTKPAQTVSRPQPAPMVNTVVYESDLKFDNSSKWLFNEKCRIVCNSRGYFVNVVRGRRFVNVRKAIHGVNMGGSIWVKKNNSMGWIPIVHIINGNEYSIGYIKEAGGGFIFKQNINQSDYMFIKSQ